MLFLWHISEPNQNNSSKFSTRKIVSKGIQPLLFVVSEFDSLQALDSTSTPITRDFIGLCIGILTVVLVILIVAICKWSRCLCLKGNPRGDLPDEGLISVVHSRPHHHQQHRPSSCSRSGNTQQYARSHRDGLLSPPQPTFNGGRCMDVKVPRVKITTLAVQPCQQLVPRLSMSPQDSSSSIARSSFSIKK